MVLAVALPAASAASYTFNTTVDAASIRVALPSFGQWNGATPIANKFVDAGVLTNYNYATGTGLIVIAGSSVSMNSGDRGRLYNTFPAGVVPTGVTIEMRVCHQAASTPFKVATLRESLMDVADMDVVMAAMRTEGAAAAMDHDGVVADTLVLLVEA